jgi:hypothetical protein
LGESQFRRGDIHCGTLYIYVRTVCSHPFILPTPSSYQDTYNDTRSQIITILGSFSDKPLFWYLLTLGCVFSLEREGEGEGRGEGGKGKGERKRESRIRRTDWGISLCYFFGRI